MNRLLSDKTAAMEESATLKMAQLARDLKGRGEEVINLSLGEPDFDTPEHIKKAAWEALQQGYTKYTPVPGLPELRKAISDKFKRDNQLDYGIDQIVVSNGAKQCIANLSLALLNPGDEVVLFTPYWVSYHDIIVMAGGVPIPIKATVEADFKIEPQQLREAISERTKFILFSSPCNPTGSVYFPRELQEIAEVVAEYPDLLVISDEIYEYINFTGNHFSIGSIAEIADRTVTVNGFSKGFAMTGWRLGYMGAPAWLADACSKIQGQFTSGANAFSQKAAVQALEGPMGPTEKMAIAFERRKNIAREKLQDIPDVKVHDPMGAFYIFPDISAYLGRSFDGTVIETSDQMAEYLLAEAHVATVSGEAFGAGECIRLSFAASEGEISKAIDRIRDALLALR